MYLLTLYLFLYQSYVCISSYAKRALAMSGRVCRFVCPSQSVCHTLVLRSERCPSFAPGQVSSRSPAPCQVRPGHLPQVNGPLGQGPPKSTAPSRSIAPRPGIHNAQHYQCILMYCGNLLYVVICGGSAAN